MHKKICIVGGGLSGSVLAKYLLEKTKFEIHVIDVDNINKKYNSNFSLNDRFPFKNFSENLITFAYGFGGSSNYWHGVLTDLDKIDLFRIKNQCGSLDWIKKSIGVTGNNLLPELNNLFKINKNQLRTLPLPEYLNKYWDDKFFLVPKKPLRGRKVLEELLIKYKKRLTLSNDSVAIKLILSKDKNSKKIEKIQINSKGEFKYIEADFFICSLGALETPRLIMQSFPKEGFIQKFAGKGLMDHPSAIFAEIKYAKKIKSPISLPTLMNSSFIRKGYKPKKLINDRNPSLGLIPANKSIKESIINLSKNIFSSEEKSILTRFIEPSKNLAAPSIHYLQSKLGFGVNTKEYNIIYHHESLISDGGYIKLANTKDNYGRYNCVFEYPSLDFFYETIDHIGYELQKLSNNNIISNLIIKKHQDIHPIPGSHYSGTCRISSNSNNGVCDNNLKVHNFSNLFICDPSVIPVIGNANLGLSIVRMASFLSSKFEEIK